MSLDVVAAMNTRVGITAHHTSQDRYQGDCKFFYSVANDLGSQAVSTPVIFPSCSCYSIHTITTQCVSGNYLVETLTVLILCAHLCREHLSLSSRKKVLSYTTQLCSTSMFEYDAKDKDNYCMNKPENIRRVWDLILHGATCNLGR